MLCFSCDGAEESGGRVQQPLPRVVGEQGHERVPAQDEAAGQAAVDRQELHDRHVLPRTAGLHPAQVGAGCGQRQGRPAHQGLALALYHILSRQGGPRRAGIEQGGVSAGTELPGREKARHSLAG